MQKSAIIWLIMASIAMGCNHRQPAGEASITMMHDTVIIVDMQHDTVVQYVMDSAAIRQMREQYAQNQYEYLRELVRTDSLVDLLWDGISILMSENQSVAAKAESLRVAVAELHHRAEQVAAVARPTAPYKEVLSASAGNEVQGKVEIRRRRAQQLLKQPRSIYTVGADDAAGELEIINSCTHNNEMYVAVEISVEGVEDVSASMNGVEAVYQYVENGRVFVFALPKLSGAVQLKFLVNGRNYVVKTNVKNLM